MSIALTYEMRGSDDRIPVLMVVIVSIVVMPVDINPSIGQTSTLLKAKYCPPAMPVQHLVNPDQAGSSSIMYTQNTQHHATLTFDV